MTEEAAEAIAHLTASAARLDGRVAIVTGAGMSRNGAIGTGAAIAHLFAAHGANVVVVDLSPDRAERTVSSVVSLGGSAVSVVGDLAGRETAGTVVEDAVTRCGRLDVLVNNLGIGRPGSVESMSIDEWDDVYRVNVTSAFLMTKAAAPHLVKAKGSIVNIASIAAIRASGAAGYGSSKAALVALTNETACSLGRRGVRANCILPGLIHASMTSSYSPATLERRRKASLLATEGVAWDIASAALFLASDESRWITAATLPVDAGACASSSLTIDRMNYRES
jgi:NAD(P)-dependent dehydrogenase (short-subunit alcohol dehydrogenase family)